ncbi:hypothetical protein B0J17DRAFT_49910 [Rhizoctonia solani]|nr:hypothetical protein B0J17DRAFT_49910 [Rhizoctonia solani]
MVDFLNRMLDDVCLKLPQLLAGRSKLSASGGLSLSKYANALPHLVQFLAQSSIYTHSRPAEPRLSPPRQQLGDRVLGLGSWWRSRRPAAKEPSGYNSGTGGSREGIEGQMPDKDSVGSKPIQLALKSLECTWEKDVPYLTADTHALLTIAELRLIENAARVCDSEAHSSCSESPHQLVPNAPHIQQNGNGSIRVLCHYRDTSDNTVVDIPMNGGKGNLKQKLEGPDLLELRARYSRVLFRAGVQLSNHSTNRIQIDPSVLKDLLKCIREAFSCARLNPEGKAVSAPIIQNPRASSYLLSVQC